MQFNRYILVSIIFIILHSLLQYISADNPGRPIISSSIWTNKQILTFHLDDIPSNLGNYITFTCDIDGTKLNEWVSVFIYSNVNNIHYDEHLLLKLGGRNKIIIRPYNGYTSLSVSILFTVDKILSNSAHTIQITNLVLQGEGGKNSITFNEPIYGNVLPQGVDDFEVQLRTIKQVSSDISSSSSSLSLSSSSSLVNLSPIIHSLLTTPPPPPDYKHQTLKFYFYKTFSTIYNTSRITIHLHTLLPLHTTLSSFIYNTTYNNPVPTCTISSFKNVKFPVVEMLYNEFSIEINHELYQLNINKNYIIDCNDNIILQRHMSSYDLFMVTFYRQEEDDGFMQEEDDDSLRQEEDVEENDGFRQENVDQDSIYSQYNNNDVYSNNSNGNNNTTRYNNKVQPFSLPSLSSPTSSLSSSSSPKSSPTSSLSSSSASITLSPSPSSSNKFKAIKYIPIGYNSDYDGIDPSKYSFIVILLIILAVLLSIIIITCSCYIARRAWSKLKYHNDINNDNLYLGDYRLIQ